MMDMIIKPEIEQIVEGIEKLEYLRNKGVITSGEFKIAVARYRPIVIEVLNLKE